MSSSYLVLDWFSVPAKYLERPVPEVTHYVLCNTCRVEWDIKLLTHSLGHCMCIEHFQVMDEHVPVWIFI